MLNLTKHLAKLFPVFLMPLIPGLIVRINYNLLVRSNLAKSDLAFFAFCWFLPLACFGIATSYLLLYKENKKILRLLFFLE